MLVVPATWEAEAGGSHLNPQGRGCSEPCSHHCTPASLSDRAKILSQKKKSKTKTKKVYGTKKKPEKPKQA